MALVQSCGQRTGGKQGQQSTRKLQESPHALLMPAPRDSDGTLCAKRPLTSIELGEVLRKVGCEGDPEVSSHSLKVTTLSWCSTAEVPREHRRILSRHATSVQDADSLYARDLAYPAVKSLETVIHDICVGKFMPDAARTFFRPDEQVLARAAPGVVNPPCVLPHTPVPAELAFASSRESHVGPAGFAAKEETSASQCDPNEVIEISSQSSDLSSASDCDSESMQ